MQSFTTKIKTQKTTVFYYIRVFTFLVYFSIRLYIYVGSSDVRIFGPRVLPCSLLHRILWSPTSKENPPTFCLISYEAKGVVYH